MENKDPQPGNNGNPKEEPDEGENRFESDFSSDQIGGESTPLTPHFETESPSENQTAVTDESTGVQEHPSEPPTPQAEIKGLEDDDSMDSPASGDAPYGLSPSTADEKVDQSSDLRAEPDVLDDLRRSLTQIEPQEKRPGLMLRLSDWWKRTFSKTRGNRADDASLNARLGGEMLSLSQQPAAEQSAVEETHVGNLFGDLEKLAGTPLAPTEPELPAPDAKVEVPAQVGEAVEPVPEKVVDASPSQPHEEPHEIERTNYELSEEIQGRDSPYANYQDLRETALEDFEEVPAEPSSGGHRPLSEVVRRTFRELTTLQKRLLAAGCVVILLVGLGVGVVLFSGSRQQAAAPTPAVVLGPSYPVEITLPAGWDFPLSVGKLQNGKWSPQRAEWLEGTEISRWVSLPWSPPLEAVIKILKPDDPLVLIMSNSDHLLYKIQSVKQQNVDSQAGVEQTIQSLVVFLSNKNSNQTWVITAVPE